MDTRLGASTFGIIDSNSAAREVHVSLPDTEQLGGPLATEIKAEFERVLFRPWGKTIEAF
jgi:hypothetical protein